MQNQTKTDETYSYTKSKRQTSSELGEGLNPKNYKTLPLASFDKMDW